MEEERRASRGETEGRCRAAAALPVALGICAVRYRQPWGSETRLCVRTPCLTLRQALQNLCSSVFMCGYLLRGGRLRKAPPI